MACEQRREKKWIKNKHVHTYSTLWHRCEGSCWPRMSHVKLDRKPKKPMNNINKNSNSNKHHQRQPTPRAHSEKILRSTVPYKNAWYEHVYTFITLSWFCLWFAVRCVCVCVQYTFIMLSHFSVWQQTNIHNTRARIKLCEKNFGKGQIEKYKSQNENDARWERKEESGRINATTRKWHTVQFGMVFVFGFRLIFFLRISYWIFCNDVHSTQPFQKKNHWKVQQIPFLSFLIKRRRWCLFGVDVCHRRRQRCNRFLCQCSRLTRAYYLWLECLQVQ